MTILRIYLFAMISALFVFGGTWEAFAAQTACLKHCEKKYCVTSSGGAGAGKCSEGYSKCAKSCEGKNR
jgi:hypothetical protein